MSLTLSGPRLQRVLRHLSVANRAFDQRYPATYPPRQPVHTLYGGAHRFDAGTFPKLSRIALETLERHLPDSVTLGAVTGMEPAMAEKVHPRVCAKLAAEAIEDYRIDFEDGYGVHSDQEEDEDAVRAAAELSASSPPPFIGIRIKPLSTRLWRRARRTLDLFLTRLASSGALPANFAVTLPKVTHAEQAAALAAMLDALEGALKLPRSSVAIELMIETPQLELDWTLVEACRGRCRGWHFGPYDYTTAIGIPGSRQSLHHAACDLMRDRMRRAAAGTGILLSDGPTKTIPKGSNEEVAKALRAHYADTRRSLDQGFLQGWDLHPAQLPARYAAVYAFFHEGLGAARERLDHFLTAQQQATLLGTQFDDEASIAGLRGFLAQGVRCGAFAAGDV